jgi:hypothetical protein
LSHFKKIVIALIAVTISAGYVWNTHRVVSGRQATWDDVLAEAQRGGYQIISTEDLSSGNYKNPVAAKGIPSC